MNLNIRVCTGNDCKIAIKDLTEVGNSGYVPESSTSVSVGRFKYSDTYSISILQHNKSDGPVLKTPYFNKSEDLTKPIILPVEFDGWFTVQYIVLPSKEWFETELNKETGSSLPLYLTVYFTDGSYIYKYFNDNITTVTIEEIVERNIEGTTISITNKNYVSICFLKRCYISLCQQLFNRGFNPCFSKSDTQDETSYKRDLAWMAINVIKYMTEFNQLAEAQRIIERIGGCNGVCKTEFESGTISGCGCGK